jgi:hypothetical protein
MNFIEMDYHAFSYLRYTVQFDHDSISVGPLCFAPLLHKRDQSPR